jgi:Transposase DDE domain
LASAIAGLAWGFASRERKPVDGLFLVLLVWTDGTLRIPLGMRRWRPGGASKIELALEWLSSARHYLHCRPESVLFDAWYPAKRLLKRIRDDGWYVVCRLQKNRRFNGHGLRHHRRPPSWTEIGWLSGGLTVLVVRDGAKYDATHRLTVPAGEVRRL